MSRRSLQTLTALAAWVLLGLVALWTLGPIQDRPRLGPPQLERFAAYYALASLFAMSYRRHPRLVAVGIVVVAVALELGQHFVPGRDPGVPDVIAKLLGGLAGVIVVVVAGAFLSKKTGEAELGGH